MAAARTPSIRPPCSPFLPLDLGGRRGRPEKDRGWHQLCCDPSSAPRGISPPPSRGDAPRHGPLPASLESRSPASPACPAAPARQPAPRVPRGRGRPERQGAVSVPVLLLGAPGPPGPPPTFWPLGPTTQISPGRPWWEGSGVSAVRGTEQDGAGSCCPTAEYPPGTTHITARAARLALESPVALLTLLALGDRRESPAPPPLCRGSSPPSPWGPCPHLFNVTSVCPHTAIPCPQYHRPTSPNPLPQQSPWGPRWALQVPKP